jgi:hypothetical protein
MTLMIALPPEDERKLAERAAANGQEMSEYVQKLIKKDIDQPSFAEILAPIHEAVRASGMGEAEIDGVIDDAIADSRRQRRGKKGS